MRRLFNFLSAPKVYSRSLPYFDQKDEILYNGIDNLRPTRVEEWFYNSSVAKQCANVYKAYLRGEGFTLSEDINLSLYEFEPYTINDLLSDICHSVSRHGGAFIHVAYDGNLQKRSFKVLPYRNCRISLSDDTGFIRCVVYKKYGWESSIDYKYNKKNKPEKFPSYNPNRAVLEAQVESYGDITEHPGQVYYLRLEKDYPYTDGLVESVGTLAEADAELNTLTKNRVLGGFQNLKILRHTSDLSDAQVDSLENQLKKSLGARNANTILRIQDDITARNPDGNFRVDSVGNDVPADVYSYYDSQISDKMRRAFLNIPHQLVQSTAGKLASTSELMQAIAIYNTFTADHRSIIQRRMQDLFDNFYIPIELGDIQPYGLLAGTEIVPLPTTPPAVPSQITP